VGILQFGSRRFHGWGFNQFSGFFYGLGPDGFRTGPGTAPAPRLSSCNRPTDDTTMHESPERFGRPRWCPRTSEGSRIFQRCSNRKTFPEILFDDFVIILESRLDLASDPLCFGSFRRTSMQPTPPGLDPVRGRWPWPLPAVSHGRPTPLSNRRVGPEHSSSGSLQRAEGCCPICPVPEPLVHESSFRDKRNAVT